MNRILLAGAALGFLSVIIGAMSEHVFRTRIDDEVFRWVMTAIRYHQVGALIVTALGLVLMADLQRMIRGRLSLSGWLFVAGTLLFSFSIYASALTGIEALTYATPVGGITLMAAWLVLARVAFAQSGDRSGV
ncbi:MAG: DUF423 domain-containing protein [Candidatus Wenzhouxiangella sp. M2_3B_020]